MADRVRVRLVPKNAEGALPPQFLSGMSPSFAKTVAPDSGRAEQAARTAWSMGMECRVTGKNSVVGRVDSERFEYVFKQKLITRKREPDVDVRGVGSHDYLTTETELEIPDELKDTVAYAYIPTPPEFAAESLVPPNTTLYHLRLSDVVRATRANLCHRQGWTGRQIRVAMADSGFGRHRYFDEMGFNISRVSTPSTNDPDVDSVGHGTGECANTLAIAPDCLFFGIKHDDFSAEALETSLDQTPRIMINSWGWNVDDRSIEDWRQANPNLHNELRDVERILNDAVDDGILVIFAAGNGHRMFPASMPRVLAVGGTTVEASGELKASSYASSFRSILFPGRAVPDLCGVVGESKPGGSLPGHIMLPVPNGSQLEGENLPANKSNKGWGIFSGTSAATPQVGGIAALMLSIDPNLSPDDIRNILSDTARDVSRGKTSLGDEAAVGRDLATGAGFVDAFAACMQVQQRTLT